MHVLISMIIISMERSKSCITLMVRGHQAFACGAYSRIVSAARATSRLISLSLSTQTHQAGTMSSDNSYPISISSRLVEARALQQDVWSMFEYVRLIYFFL